MTDSKIEKIRSNENFAESLLNFIRNKWFEFVEISRLNFSQAYTPTPM